MKKPTQNYSAWSVQETDFPAKAPLSEKINFLVSYGILAPSTHNTQPWQVTTTDNTMLIKPNPNKLLPYSDPTNRNLFMSLGAFTMNILVAASHFGLIAKESISQEGDITLTFSEDAGQSKSPLASLMNFLSQRFSDKRKYLPKRLSPDQIKTIVGISQTPEAKIIMFDQAEQINLIASLQLKAMDLQAQNKSLVKELLKWLRLNNTKKPDGMPGFVMGLKPIQTFLLLSLLAVLPQAFAKSAKQTAETVKQTPAVGVVVTQGDQPVLWVRAGMCFERAVLQAAALGVNSSPLASIIESSIHRAKLTKILASEHLPQLVVRFGYGYKGSFHTPRRSRDQ